MKRRNDDVGETEVNFDKFVDDILVKEERAKSRDASDDEEAPQRKYARRVREHAANRTRVSR